MSLITASVSISNFIKVGGQESLSSLHRENMLSENMLRGLASWLGSSQLGNLDCFIQEAFPFVWDLYEEEEAKGNWGGDSNTFPELEGEYETYGDLSFWLGLLSPEDIISKIKEMTYPEQVLMRNLYNSMDDRFYEDYLEVLMGLLDLVSPLDKPSIEEEIECLLDKMEANEQPREGKGWWIKDSD